MKPVLQSGAWRGTVSVCAPSITIRQMLKMHLPWILVDYMTRKKPNLCNELEYVSFKLNKQFSIDLYQRMLSSRPMHITINLHIRV